MLIKEPLKAIAPIMIVKFKGVAEAGASGITHL